MRYYEELKMETTTTKNSNTLKPNYNAGFGVHNEDSVIIKTKIQCDYKEFNESSA